MKAMTCFFFLTKKAEEDDDTEATTGIALVNRAGDVTHVFQEIMPTQKGAPFKIEEVKKPFGLVLAPTKGIVKV